MTSGKMHAMAIAAMLLGAPAGAQALELRVMTPNLKPEGGRVVVAVYNDPKAWKAGGAPQYRAVLPVQDGRVTAVFQAPAGRYAVAVFQDRDGDGKLGQLPFGWPTEASGYSGVANRPMFGRPAWDAADFPLQDDQRMTVFVRLK